MTMHVLCSSALNIGHERYINYLLLLLLLTFPKTRTKKTLADRPFSCAAPRLWNLLPTTIRSTSSLDIFKIRLKTFFYLIGHLISYYSCYN